MTADAKIIESRKQIEQADELKLYFMIQEIGNFIWKMEQDVAQGLIPKNEKHLIEGELSRLRPLQLHAVFQLRRMGVEEPLKEDGVSPTPEYWMWYQWWDNYIKGITEEQWKDLQERIQTDKDYSEFRPEGNWKK